MDMPICVTCGEQIAERTKYIAVLKDGIGYYFRWGCMHHPIGDAEVYLGSADCAEQWVAGQGDETLLVLWQCFMEARMEC